MIVYNFSNLLPIVFILIYCIRGLTEIRKDLLNKNSDIEMVAFFGNLILLLVIDKFVFESFFIITLLQLMKDWLTGLLNLLSAFMNSGMTFIFSFSSSFSSSYNMPIDMVTWLVQTITIMLLVLCGVLFYCICFIITTSCYAFTKILIQKNILHNYPIQTEDRT